MPSTDLSPVTVRHVSKNHVTISTNKDFTVVLFNLADGNVEAVASDGTETIRLLIAGPGDKQTMTIKTHQPTGIIDIVYTETPRGKS